MKRTHSISPWLVVLGLGLVGLLFVATFGPAAQAQSTPGPLTPPFRFVERQQPHAPSIDFVPPGSTVLLTETFGASFAPTTTLTGGTPEWRVITDTADTAGYYWGRVADTAPVTFTNSAWPAVEPIAGGTVLTPGVDAYPPGQDTWLIYGPIDVSGFTYAHLGFESWRDIAASDLLSWGFSTDGQTFYGNQQNGVTSEWVTNTLSMPLNWMTLRSQYLYLGFHFKSGVSPAGLGAFIRELQLTAEPIHYVYLPLVLRMPTPTPSPTPTPTATPDPAIYKYQFDEPDPFASGSDLNKWGGYFYKTHPGSYGPYAIGQTVRLGHGNPKNSLTLYTTGTFVIAAGSPNNLAPTNFDLYVDVSPWIMYQDSLYGVIFEASNNTFGANPGAFNGGGNFYLVYFGTGNSTAPKGVRLDRCGGGSCTRLSGNAGNDGFIAVPPGTIGNASGWDNLHVRRNGSAISVWVNNTLLFTVNNSAYVGSRKWGVFVLPFNNDSTCCPPSGNQLQVDFDNIKLYGLP